MIHGDKVILDEGNDWTEPLKLFYRQEGLVTATLEAGGALEAACCVVMGNITLPWTHQALWIVVTPRRIEFEEITPEAVTADMLLNEEIFLEWQLTQVFDLRQNGDVWEYADHTCDWIELDAVLFRKVRHD